MQEIKFRAKDIHLGEWIYGWVVNTNTPTPAIIDFTGDFHQIQIDTLGQYTRTERCKWYRDIRRRYS